MVYFIQINSNHSIFCNPFFWFNPLFFIELFKRKLNYLNSLKNYLSFIKKYKQYLKVQLSSLINLNLDKKLLYLLIHYLYFTQIIIFY